MPPMLIERALRGHTMKRFSAHNVIGAEVSGYLVTDRRNICEPDVVISNREMWVRSNHVMMEKSQVCHVKCRFCVQSAYLLR